MHWLRPPSDYLQLLLKSRLCKLASQNLVACPIYQLEPNGRSGMVCPSPLLPRSILMICTLVMYKVYCRDMVCSGFSTMRSSKRLGPVLGTLVAGVYSSKSIRGH